MTPFSTVTVGVASLDEALDLWAGTFGLSVAERRDGPDEALARLWDIEALDISRQALVTTPGETVGRLHLVEFVDPDPPVRAGAAVFDSCPKNLDVYVRDMPAQFAALKAAGTAFRNDTYSDVTAPNGIRFREIHMPAHDAINVVLLELVGKAMTFSDAGYAGIGPLITIVPDAAAEKAFYQGVIGLDILSDNILAGPEIEKMVGLPPGAALNVSIWGKAGVDLGQIEIIEYQGVRGADLYPRARPKALGILHVTYHVAELDALLNRLKAAGTSCEGHGRVDTLAGVGETVSFRTPSGFRIEAVGIAR